MQPANIVYYNNYSSLTDLHPHIRENTNTLFLSLSLSLSRIHLDRHDEFGCLHLIHWRIANDSEVELHGYVLTTQRRSEKIVTDPLYERHVGRPEFRSKGGDKKLLVYFPWRCRSPAPGFLATSATAWRRLDRFQGRRSGLTSRNCAGLRVFVPTNRL